MPRKSLPRKLPRKLLRKPPLTRKLLRKLPRKLPRIRKLPRKRFHGFSGFSFMEAKVGNSAASTNAFRESLRSSHSWRLSTTAAVLAALPLSTIRPYTSSGLAACSPPSHRSSTLAWVGWCLNPIGPSWVGSPLPPLMFASFAHTGHV